MSRKTGTFSLILLIGLSTRALPASDGVFDRGGTLAYTWPWSARLDTEINHLNRMRGHVRWQLQYYQARANAAIRSDFGRISRDVDHINAEFKGGNYDRVQLHQRVERLHADLHGIETRLRVRASDYYRWH
jgi:hypothetical protein